MANVLAVDPGNEQSAYVEFDGAKVLSFGILPNDEMRDLVLASDAEHMAIEGIACYGMPVGKETFDTCIWIGRFIECWNQPWTLVYRSQVKMHLCQKMTAKDANIRQALIDLFGPGKAKAIGVKKSKGPLYGVSSHCWAALAVAVTFQATRTA